MESIKSAISSSLKAKLLELEKTLDAIREEINFQKKEVATLRSEKETLEKVLTMKAEDVRKSLTTEVNRVDSEMRDKFKSQKAENNKLQQQATVLKQEKTNLQQNLLALQRRIGELELQIGSGHH
uniref:Uncharacterized protein n=1 Tax=Euplotes harpa TaxID=151035 RepID=A0A7S3N5S6_9SPIT|mmetsp:Transcript_14167/g.16404  ORF Transcript_14167/g.16404 Transcript_14167/m.16404 type:complete len:125 (-) Transcript_14167:36-410(-)